MERGSHTSLLFQPAFLMSCAPEKKPPAGTAEVASLVQRISAGDSIAFEQFLLRYERRVLLLAMRLLGVMDDAQDAAQEVFLKTFKYIHRFDIRKPVEPWLMRMTVNVCRDIGRNRQRRRNTFTEISEPEMIADQSAGPYDGVADEQRRQMLWTALKNLPEKERMAVILRDVEGLSTSEVAEILRSSETTVRSQISRARLRMKVAIEQMTGGQS